MIKFYKHSEINKTKWNDCISHAVCSSIFADYDLLSIASPQWDALIADDYTAVMPLPWKKKWNISYIYTPFFFSRLGIFSLTTLTAQQVSDFVSAIPRRFVRVELNLKEDNLEQLISDKVIWHISHQLSLSSSYEEIRSRYATNLKRNIKAARQQLLTIDTHAPVSEIIHLFKCNRGKDRKIKIKDVHYGFFLQMVEMLQKKQQVDVWGIRTEDGTLIAGACFLKDFQRTWYWFSGRDEKYNQQRALFRLVDAYIEAHANQSIFLDFNGSLDPNTARFYREFGSTKYIFPLLNYSRYAWCTPLLKLYQTLKFR